MAISFATDAESVDVTLRHVAHRFPEDLARALLPEARTLRGLAWHDTQLTARERRLDKSLYVEADGEARVEHCEWQMRWTRELLLRVYEYHALMTLALRQGASAGAQVPLVRSTVVLLQGRRERPWPAHRRFRTAPRDEGFSGLRVRIEPVYQRTVQELADRGSPFWMVFAPLAVDATPGAMLEVLRALRASASDARFEELAVAMAVLADADTRARGLRAPIEAFLPGEILMKNFIYDRGLAAGREQGIEQGIERGIEQGIERGIEQGIEQGIERGIEQGIERGIEQGIERGRVEAARALLLETLRARGMRVGVVQRAHIDSETREAVLRRWFSRALVATRASELFEDPV